MYKFKVSIIVPTYNVEQYIIPCLQSVAEQTFEDIECIIVDDCGKDESIAKAKSFVNSYSGPISYSIVHRDTNGGLSAARNTGLKTAQGEFLYFLDSDDLLQPNSIADLLQAIGDCDVCVGSYKTFVDGGVKNLFNDRILEDKVYNGRNSVIRSYVDGFWPVTAWNKLIKHTFIEECSLLFQESLIHEDEMWTFNMFKHIQSLATCSSVTYKYRQRPGSIMTVENPKNRSDLAKILTDIVTYTANSDDTCLYGYCQYMYRFISTAVFSNKVTIKSNKCFYNMITELPIKMESNGFWGSIMSYNINHKSFFGFYICYILAGLCKRGYIKLS